MWGRAIELSIAVGVLTVATTAALWLFAVIYKLFNGED